jgi:hypothetical protein
VREVQLVRTLPHRAWSNAERAHELRAELEALRISLLDYTNLLAQVAEVEPPIALNDG